MNIFPPTGPASTHPILTCGLQTSFFLCFSFFSPLSGHPSFVHALGNLESLITSPQGLSLPTRSPIAPPFPLQAGDSPVSPNSYLLSFMVHSPANFLSFPTQAASTPQIPTSSHSLPSPFQSSTWDRCPPPFFTNEPSPSLRRFFGSPFLLPALAPGPSIAVELTSSRVPFLSPKIPFHLLHPVPTLTASRRPRPLESSPMLEFVLGFCHQLV